MVFMMAELRQELQALGYGALPDDFIGSSLSQLQLEVLSQPWNDVEKVGDRNGSMSISSSRRIRFAEKSSRQAHGPPVPGDREFATSRKRGTGKGGKDSICFTPDFATEFDELRKMLKVMLETEGETFGSVSVASTQRTILKPMGLADEHEIHVGNVSEQWRVVARSIRSKRKGCLAVDVGARVNNCNIGCAPSSETGTQLKLEIKQHASSGITGSSPGHQHKAFIDGEIRPLAQPSASGQLERPGGGCVSLAEINVLGSTEDELSSSSFKEVVVADDSKVEGLNEGCTNGLKSKKGGPVRLIGIDTGPVFTRQESSSAISPGVSYQQGGMLYPENFTTYEHTELIMSQEIPRPSLEDADDGLLRLHLHQEADNNPFSTSPSTQLTNDQNRFLAAFKQSLDDLCPTKDIIIDQETFAHANQKISETANHAHVSVRNQIAQQPVESENALELGVHVVVRTPDRRGGGGGRHQSPLNDRSNMRIVEDRMVKKPEFHFAETLKRGSSAILKRSRSSRVVSRRNEIVDEAHDKPLSDNVKGGGQVDSHLLFENKSTTPPSSARQLQSERILGHSKSKRRIEIVEEAYDTRPWDNLEGSQVDSHLLLENRTTPPSSARKLKSERILGYSKSVAFSRTRNEIVEEATYTHPSENLEGRNQVGSHLLSATKTTTPLSSTRKLNSDKILGHSQSVAVSRWRNEIVEEANGKRPSDNLEGRSQVDSQLLTENTTTPPPIARNLKSKSFHQLSKSAEKSSSSTRLTYRHTRTVSALDGTDLEVPSLGLSPMKSVSGLIYPSPRDRACVANGFSEHRLGTHCSACCNMRHCIDNNTQSTIFGSKNLVGRNLSKTALSETEASPQQKRSLRTGAGAWALSKQKVASNRSVAAVYPGISTPLVDPKNNDLNSNSKMLLKTRRLGSSMDIASDSSRLTERRTPSLRSSKASSRSSGPQPAPSAQS